MAAIALSAACLRSRAATPQQCILPGTHHVSLRTGGKGLPTPAGAFFFQVAKGGLWPPSASRLASTITASLSAVRSPRERARQLAPSPSSRPISLSHRRRPHESASKQLQPLLPVQRSAQSPTGHVAHALRPRASKPTSLITARDGSNTLVCILHGQTHGHGIVPSTKYTHGSSTSDGCAVAPDGAPASRPGRVVDSQPLAWLTLPLIYVRLQLKLAHLHPTSLR